MSTLTSDRVAQLRRGPLPSIVGCAVALVVLFVVSQGLSDRGVAIVVLACIWTVVGLSQTIAMGIGGVVTFGQAAFCAIGAFLFANLVFDRGYSLPVAIAVSCLIVAALAAIGGLAILQLRGYVLSIGTLGVYLATNNLLPQTEWLTGGWGGRPIPPLADVPRTAAFIYMAITVVTLTAVHLIFRSRWGRRVVAIRDDETAAASVGIPVFRTRLLVFSLSAGVGALGGILYAAQIGYASHEAFSLSFLTAMFVVAVIGGLRWVWGALAGGCVYVLLHELTVDLGEKSALVYALVFLGVMLVAPGGMYDLIVSAREWVARRRGDRPSPKELVADTDTPVLPEPVTVPARGGDAS